MKRRPVVIDANSVIVRAIMATALEDLRAGVDGPFTGGVYGATRTLVSVLNSPGVAASRIVAFFDAGVPPRRLELLPDYKSKRKESRQLLTPEQKERAFQQINACADLWPTLGVTCLSYKDREADDGVAAASRIFLERGDTPLIVTTDRDLWQCIAWGAEVWSLRDAVIVDRGNFEETTGVDPGLWLLYRALSGDPSDSIRGVPGCGPKRSAELVASVGRIGVDETYLPPRGSDAIGALLALLSRRPYDGTKLRKFEESVLQSEPMLRRTYEAINLWDSFGRLDALRARIEASASVDRKAFLRGAAKLGFASFLGDPDGVLGPFVAAACAPIAP